MRLTLPAQLWAAIDQDRAGVYLGSWVARFIVTHHAVPIIYPDAAWLYANGEGIPTRGLLPPPGWTMTSRQVNLAHRVPGIPDRVEADLLRARALADGRPMAEVFRRLVRAHFEGRCPCGNDPNENRCLSGNNGPR